MCWFRNTDYARALELPRISMHVFPVCRIQEVCLNWISRFYVRDVVPFVTIADHDWAKYVGSRCYVLREPDDYGHHINCRAAET